ncbi:MAG: metal ABC transporter permease [Oscillospiraceae bacterium]|nr:metal ABC transporter permease [Oscillospiraceae bacterium]
MEFIYFIIEKLFPFSWVEFNFMKNAFIAILLISVLFGIVSTMIVNNKMSFFSDALGHCVFTGIALGVMLGIDNYIISMMAFAIIFALGISTIINSGISSSDTIIGVFSSAGISLGIVVLSFGGGFSKYSGYLIGDILSVTKQEIHSLFIILAIVVLIWFVSFNKLIMSSLNKELALSKGVNVKFYKNIFVILIALIVTISLKLVGMLVINSLLVLPAASAKNISKNIKSYHIISILFSMFSGVSGLIISYYIGTSAGASIVIISSIIFFVTFFIAINKNSNYQ